MKNTTNKNTTVKDAARHFWGKTQFEYATNNKLEKVESDICMLSESYATDGSFMIYGAGELEFEPVKNSRYRDLPREQIEPVIMPYLNANVCAKVPGSLFGHLAAGHSKMVFLAAAGRWCSFVANCADSSLHVQDGADMGDFFNLGGIKATFSGVEIAKIFKKFKVEGVEICRPSKGSDFMRFYFTFKGVKFTAILLKCYRDDYSADYEDEAETLVNEWAAEDEAADPAPVEAVATYPAAPVAACEAPKAEDSDDSAENAKNDGIRIEKNAEFGSVEIYFKEKPSLAVRDALKTAHFRWHGVKKCWYGYADADTVRHMIEAAEGIEAINAENFDAEGKKAREGVDVPPEDKKAPEAKETAKAEAEKIAAMITSSPEGEYNLPDHWRKVWRECGIKGVTVRNNRGGYSYHFTFTFRLLPGDVIPESEALPMLEDKFRADPRFWGEWINDPDIEDECRGNVYYTAFYGWDAEKKERFFKDAARRSYDRMCKNGPGCAVHAWVFYLEREKMRREYPIFTAQFWDRLEIVARSVSFHNYDNSDSQTDYFDVGFYETWDFEPMKEGAKDYTSMAEKLHAVAELFREKDKAAEKAAEAAREAEHAEYIEKCKKQEQHAREVIDEYIELFPGDAYHPHIIVEWSELGAMNDRGRERGDSTIFSVEAFEAITGELDAYFKDDQGYYKLKFEFVDPVHGDHHFVDRCDIGEGTGSYGSRARMVIKWCKEHPNQEYMRDGGATCTPAEGTTDAYYYLENIPATFDEINAA